LSSHAPSVSPTDDVTAQDGADTRSPGTRLRVLMMIDKMYMGGGAERTMVALAKHLPRDRYEVVVATTRPSGGPLLETMLANGTPHLGLDRHGRFDVAPFRRLAAFMRRQQIDIVHAHMFGSNLWGTVFGRLTRVPVVIAHEQTWSYEGERLRKWLDGHVIGRLADAFVAVSERDRDRMIELEGVPPEKIVLLPNPYVPRPDGTPVDLRRELDIPPDAPLVGTVSVLRPQKALHVLIEAFGILLRSMPDAHLILGGGGESRGELERRTRELGLADRVHFLGWCEDVGGVLKTIDVAAMSSDYEGSPLFALECMAHGTPLVSTDVGNVATLLEEGVSIVPRRDPQALAGAIEGLLADPERRRAQAAAAAARLPRYHIDNVTREFCDLYERLIEEAAARPTWGRRRPQVATR
jgi:glycosyltransferase involved in cell wall biosynthesis